MLARTSAAIAVLLLTACPGGHKDTTSRLGGVVSFAAGEVSDGDVADPNAPYRPNDTPEAAQVVPGGSRIGGWVGAGMDELDWYRTTLTASQQVSFTVVEAAANGGITACLFAVTDTTTPTDCVSPSGATDVLTAPDAGDYYVRVEAVSGASSYLLRIGASAAVAIGPPALHLSAEFVPGEVLVRFREPAPGRATAPGQRARAAATDLGLELAAGAQGGPALLRAAGAAERAFALRRLGLEPLSVAPGGAALDPVVDAKRETLRMVAGLRARADVASADPNYVFHPTYLPTDPDAFCTPEAANPPCHHWQQWHYGRIGVPQAWDAEPTRGAGVIVAVIDTGVLLAHPELEGKLTTPTDGYDFVSDPTAARDGNGIDSNPNDPGDDARAGQSSYHGTHVTGTIVAAASNGRGGAGIAFGAKVMPVRALGVGGGTSSDIIQAVRYAAGRANASGKLPTRRADVANLSFGCIDCYSATEEAEYQAARDAGVILVAAAGNDGKAVDSYPAAYPSVISVGAVTSATPTALASYSNTGPTVALVAPGGDNLDRDGDGKPDMVFSTWVDDSTTPGTQKPVYAFMAGTSMASPHVAGVVALMKAACPTLGPDQLRFILTAGKMTDPVGAAPRNDTFGYGLVDAAKGVQAALLECDKPVPPSLTATPARFVFAPAQDSKLVSLATSGGDRSVVVTVTSVDPGAAWLTVERDAVDANGLGTYRLTVNRSDAALAANGTYAATVLFGASSGTVLPVLVSVTVGPTASGPGGGFAYVLLFTCNDFGQPLKDQGEDAGFAGGGGFRYDFPLLVSGRYCMVAGTDDDNDGAICGEGEACSIQDPANATALLSFALSGSQLDHDLTLTYQATAAAASAGIPIPAAAFRRAAATPAAGAR
jgi:serine protease